MTEQNEKTIDTPSIQLENNIDQVDPQQVAQQLEKQGTQAPTRDDIISSSQE